MTVNSNDSQQQTSDGPVDQTVVRFGSIPPHGLVLLAIAAIQLGAALATSLFPLLGAEGTVAVRIIMSALLLGFVARKRVHTFGQTFRDNFRLMIVFGLCAAAMNLFFYMAIARIPLGAAVAFEFIGPLGLAACKSRRLIHFIWVGLAAFGILLLSPLTGADLDPVGIVYALLAGAGWAVFVIVAGRAGKHMSGNDGLVIGMAVAAVLMIPLAVPVLPALFSDPVVLLSAFGVAVFSTAIPFTFEFEALKRLSARTYGVLVSIEPAAAALVGAVLLGERIGLQGSIAVGCVVLAAIGISISDKKPAQ